MDLKELLGEESYNQLITKLGDKKIAVVSDGNWIPKEKFDQVNSDKKEYKKQVDNLNTELDKLQDQLKDNQGAQDKIKELQGKIESSEKAMTKVRKDTAIDIALTKAKSKNIKAVKSNLDLEKIELNEDGYIKGLDDQLTKLKESDSYLFEEETPPGGTGGAGNFGRQDNNQNQNTGDADDFIKVIHENQAKRN